MQNVNVLPDVDRLSGRNMFRHNSTYLTITVQLLRAVSWLTEEMLASQGPCHV